MSNIVDNNFYALLTMDEGEQCDDDDVDITVCMSNVTVKEDDTITTAQLTDDEWLEDESKITLRPSAVSMPTRSNAWQSIIQANNLQQIQHAEMAFNAARVTRAVKHAISDSGATGHFLVEGAPAVNIRETDSPIKIMLPNGKTIWSTHTCNLDIPWLPDAMTEAHIVPGLSHSSLISTRKFCDAGCKVVFDMTECRVYYKNSLVLTGKRDPKTMLWRLPINPAPTPQPSLANAIKMDVHLMPHQQANHMAYNVYTIPYKQNQMKYMHQSFFNAPIHTILHAIDNKQMEGIPFMKADLIRKYLAKSPATSKGRMRRPRQGIRSTRPKPNKNKAKESKPDKASKIHPNAIRTSAHLIPDDEQLDGANNVFCFAALADKRDGTLYTDATGALPVRSLEGNQYYFVAYDYDTNNIFAEPVKDMTDASIIGGFEAVFESLKEKGFKPKFNVTDNQAANSIKRYLKTQDCEWQFVEPSNHRVNAAERAIQTYKNHFISGLCSTDYDWPLQLWDQLTVQAVLTLNILRTSRIDPTKSAYEQLHGHKYDWNRHPLAPPGTRAVLYEDPDSRTSWGPRGIDAWYCGPALDHYRCGLFYCPATKAYRISGSYDLFPQHCMLPEFTPDEHANEVYDELLESIGAMHKKGKSTLLSKMARALRKIATNATPTNSEGEAIIQRVDMPTTSEGADDIQRVNDAPPITTTTNPTDPRTLRTKPRTHMRVTRANTPGTLPPIRIEEGSRINTEPVRRSKRLDPTIIPDPIVITPLKPNSYRIPMASSNIISQEAVNILTTRVWSDEQNTWTPDAFITSSGNTTNDATKIYDQDIEHFCAPVIHPITGEHISSYNKLAKDPATKEVWTTSLGKEFGNIAQGDKKTGEKGTDCVFVMTPEQVQHIPKDRVVTYARIVVDYRPQKKDPNRVRITAGGNLINYPGELTTRTADLTTSKILWNSVLSTDGAKFMGIDVKSFYLCTPMDRYEYMKMPISIFPEHIQEQYNMKANAIKGFIYLEIRKAIYGLPQGGILANKLLRKRLAPEGYYEVAHTPGLWRHTTRPISFSLVVDDFGVKYVGKQHADHLLEVLHRHYQTEIDWKGSLYCGITLEWNYEGERYLDISMPGYIEKVRQRFKHEMPAKPQHCPYQPQPRKYGTAAQDPLDEDTTPSIDEERTRVVQQVVGMVLYCARACHLTSLVGLSGIASQQADAKESTEMRVKQLLDYLATHPVAVIRYYASDMILNIHSDASYLSEPKARSRVAGHYFLGSKPIAGKPIKLNGAIFTFFGILKFVVASAAEAELGALFLNCKEGRIIRLILEELGHKQPPTPIHCDNKTAAGIANDTVKKQRSRSFEMRFFYVTDQVKRGEFDVQWHPGQENLADYFTKHFDGKHHEAVRPWYLHMPNSPRFLPRAVTPSTLRGCVGTLPNGYTRVNPLPRVNPI